MKKIILILILVLFGAVPTFADTVYNGNTEVINGKIDGVMDGLINIKTNGTIVSIVRKTPSPVFKDTVIARKHTISRQKLRYSGKIIFADSSFVKILCEDTKVVIPRYRVENIEIYVP